MIEGAAVAGVPFGWVAGDEVCGGNPKLREWLEGQEIAYVMAVACSEMITVAAGGCRRGPGGAPGAPGGGWPRGRAAGGEGGAAAALGRVQAAVRPTPRPGAPPAAP